MSQKLEPELSSTTTFLGVNIRSLVAHLAELVARLEVLRPTFVVLTATWLDESPQEIVVSGYHFVCRLDWRDGKGLR